VDLLLRPVADDEELMALLRVIETAFQGRPHPHTEPTPLMRYALDRTAAAFVGGEMVGGGRNFPFELVVPGGARLPMAGVSWVGTLPTHRRQGVLRATMDVLTDDARAHGEPIMGLTASESVIYGRFGYGTATYRTTLEVERRTARLRRAPAPGGRIRILTDDEARQVLPVAYDRVIGTQPGAVTRPEPWWSDEYFDDPLDERHFHQVVHEDDDGAPDGFVAYTLEQSWADGIPKHTVACWELQAVTSEVRLALWQFLFDLDLVETIRVHEAPVDEPLRYMLEDARRLRVVELRDKLWLKLLDVSACLSARSYSVDGQLVLDVVADHDDSPAGAYRVESHTGSASSCEPTSDAADVRLGARELAAVYLGGARVSSLARAGLVEERTPGALALADAMFASSPPPYTGTWF
jgi:predicted acetyltransferase